MQNSFKIDHFLLFSEHLVKRQVSIGKIPGSLSVKNKSETGSSSSRITLVVKLLCFLTVQQKNLLFLMDVVQSQLSICNTHDNNMLSVLKLNHNLTFFNPRSLLHAELLKGTRGVQHGVWTHLHAFWIIRESIDITMLKPYIKATNGGQHEM